ncbi:DUF5313 family protein [Saccharomonospora azurea]|uniref:Uncharacterized protein n=1 Tax=Saccharomonospora azurea NA-128 TaxID=882081 RepID=H8GC35_9PSEU|nr:DUF5313 family protein [Saccharomonospora azurea]EHK87631.1 hypothetical protein SZMC14600_09928 [Saccharomonospora azurea SZMC 14600]EHY87712.1 hypothetical protein SacazDRAFT_00764 [Saccharomonospora azurea NA-128]
MAGQLRRPSPHLWLWYALGGRLPDRYREWVLHDVTSKTWLWRHGARTTFLVGPLSALWLLLPGPLWLRLCLVLLAVLVGYFYSFAFAEENVEHRLTKHGYSYGAGRRLRAAARAEAEADVRERYLARYRQSE